MTPKHATFDFESISGELVKHMPLALVIIDAKARIQYYNPQFLVMFGARAGDNHHTLGEFVEAGALQNFLEELSSLVKNQQDHMEITCRYNSGQGNSLRWMHVQFIPLPPGIKAGDQNHYYYGVIDDVTNNIDETQRIVREKELAIQATRSKSSFLATMSHEIRTPIHTVTGMTELLLDTKLDDEQQEYIKQIRFSAEILLGLINDILDLSKIEAGRLNLEIIEFDLIRTIEESIDMQCLAVFNKGLELNLQCDEDVPHLVRGDPVRVRQIITNLLSNALKFTKNGEIRVRVSVVRKHGAFHEVRFDVIDTGIGIPAEKKDLLFQAFTQVDSSMTRRFGGTGLGLSICKSLVGMMDGGIGVESQAGMGSNFWFEIPFEQVSTSVRRKTSLESLLSGKKILVVDDIASSRVVIHSILDGFHADIHDAENALAALALMRNAAIARTPYDLALVDLEMPGMDGWQLASEVNSDRTINGTRLFLMVPPGKMGGEAKMKLLNWFDDYMPKPIKRHDLVSVLERSLQTSLDLGIADEDTPINLQQDPRLTPVLTQTVMSVNHKPKSGFLVLVAEDHFVNQKLFETILTRLGYRVILASDGREALQKGLASKPDLIFMDVQMPAMNGYEATQALRQAGFTSPIIAVTANALKGDQDKCLQVGMNDYLSKPFQKSDVEVMLGKWLVSIPHAHATAEENQSVAKSGLAQFVASTLQEATSDTASEVFDFQHALDVFMGDKDTLLMVISDYIKRTVNQIDQIVSLIETRDYRTAGLHAHTIKGSSWNLGIAKLGRVAEKLEDACNVPDLELARKHIPALRAEWDAFVKTAGTYLGG